MCKLYYLLFLSLGIVFAQPAMAEPSESEANAIVHLIEFIKKSPNQFIRNSQVYVALEAGKHIEEKYLHYKSKIGSAEEFISKCASTSMMSGKPYLVRFADGSEKTVANWLGEELGKYRKK